MSASISTPETVTPTTADSTTNEMAPSGMSQGFSLLSRADFAAGINSFREHFGQEVRSKIPEGYTFLGLDKMGLLQQTPVQNTAPRSVEERSNPAGQHLALSSAGSGMSPAHSSTSPASNFNNPANGSAAPLKPAKVSVPMQHASDREKLSTLDNLLSYMKRSPQPAAATARTTGLYGKTSGLENSKFVKTVVVSEAKSRVDALNFSLPDHLSIDIPSIERLVNLQRGLDKLQVRLEQNQQREKEQQQQQQQQQKLKLDKKRQQDVVNPSPRKGDTMPSDNPEEKDKQKYVGGLYPVVEIERGPKEYRAISRSADRKRNGSVARELDPTAEDDDITKPSQKQPLSHFTLHIRVPKKARRQLIEALSSISNNKRQAPTDYINDEVQRLDKKRARKSSVSSRNNGDIEPTLPHTTLQPPSPAHQTTSNSQSSSISPSQPIRKIAMHGDSRNAPAEPKAASALASRMSRSRSPSVASEKKSSVEAVEMLVPEDAQKASSKLASKLHLRDGDLKRGRGLEKQASTGIMQQRSASRESVKSMPTVGSDGPKSIGATMQTSEIEQLRRQSTRLENFMRSFKRNGDSERDPGGRVELEIGHYLESLSCCLEDFWCRRAFYSPSDVSKNWQTMLGICEYLYKRCDSRELAAFRGCTGLISACVYYQLLSVSAEITQHGNDPERVKQAVVDISKYTGEMEKYEQGWRTQLSAHHVSRLFPQTWGRCQEIAPRLGPFEIRSSPYTKRWPAVAYPVGATSNPLDVANFVRQIDHEWLSRLGLALKMPNQKETS
ncbi:hypothetical protein GGI11_005244 [Coemansia sp. RSA 2049]|nr:hypothetical protein GGI11_005244 [Coemansia sp. RSA 2049]